jgi:hypothetical protein
VGCLVGRHQAKKRARAQQTLPQYDRASVLMTPTADAASALRACSAAE